MSKNNLQNTVSDFLKGKDSEFRQHLSQQYVIQLRAMFKTSEYLCEYLSVDDYQKDREKFIFQNWMIESEKKSKQLEGIFPEMENIGDDQIEFLLQGFAMMMLINPVEMKKGIDAPFFGELEKCIKRSWPKNTVPKGETLVKRFQ